MKYKGRGTEWDEGRERIQGTGDEMGRGAQNTSAGDLRSIRYFKNHLMNKKLV